MPPALPLQNDGGVLLFWLLLIVLFLAAVYWVYTDAQKNSEQSAFLCALVVVFGAVLGVLLYLLLGREEAPTESDGGDSLQSDGVTECPECHGIEQRDRDTCRFCGAELS